MRDDLIDAILVKSPWASWAKTPIAGDASARRYFRLVGPERQSLILMDDPPNGTNATTRFADITNALTNAGLIAPNILLHDAALGLMVIDDLGATDFAAHLASQPMDEPELYSAATDILAQLHLQSFSLPLATITPPIAAEMIGLATEFYSPTTNGADALSAAMLTSYAKIVDPTPHLALRDFHAENLIWQSDTTERKTVGLLDFQDACYAPAGYDLMSLLRDARRDVDPLVADKSIRQFCDLIGKGSDEMSGHLACVAAQRNLRILGIFARLAKVDGKVKYLSLLPRVWAHLILDLSHPALADLKRVVLAILPPPNAETLTRLSAK